VIGRGSPGARIVRQASPRVNRVSMPARWVLAAVLFICLVVAPYE
jgi:hypothetical protein